VPIETPIEKLSGMLNKEVSAVISRDGLNNMHIVTKSISSALCQNNLYSYLEIAFAISPSRKILDHLGREVEVPLSPQRIVSVVPSQSEFLFELGLDHRIIGITKFCIHPRENFKSREKVVAQRAWILKRLNP
jgi:ABC-type Fe3+-hydroxamate transport system substrate-binding protein